MVAKGLKQLFTFLSPESTQIDEHDFGIFVKVDAEFADESDDLKRVLAEIAGKLETLHAVILEPLAVLLAFVGEADVGVLRGP